MTSQSKTIGFIGLGAMGAPMSKNLLAANYNVTVYDIDASKMANFPEAHHAKNAEAIVKDCDIIMTSVPSFEVATGLANNLLEHAREGQVFIEFSTMTPSQAIELAEAYADKGIIRLDIPVSGGSYGSERAILRMFVGGDETVARACWDIFEVLGDPDRIVYCGEAGRGQMVKIVNQLSMGLQNAIFLETIGYGVQMGIEIDAMMQAIGGEGAWRETFNKIATHIRDNDPTHTDVKFVQLKQFADDAKKHGYELPLTSALFDFCDKGERVTQEEIYPAPSFWHELIRNNNLE